jgi:ABC-type nitrate/sulfonate/bicarbonate transport system permease component
MADVFLSYNRNDRARIEPIASALGLLGVSVWYDARLQSGASFDEVIARELDDAALVVACWSPDSLASRWARSEALFALDQQKLAAVFLRPCKLSPPFNLIHAEDLADWEGQPGHHGFAKLVERIATALQRPGLAEMSEGVSGGDAALYGWARRYPEEPKAKEIWRLARSRHEAEFEAEVEAARAEIERLAATHKEAALAALASCRDGFESWIEAERIGAAIARPEPQASVQSLFASEESTAAKARAERLSRQFGEAEERLARIEKERDLHSAKAVAAEAALNTANAELGAARSEIRSTRDRFSKLQRDRDALAAKAQSVEAEAARLREALTKADAAAQTEKASRASKIEELEQAVTQARTRRDALTERLTGSATGAPNISEAGTIHGGRFSAPIGVAAIAFLWILAAVLGSSSQLVPAPGEVMSRLAQATLWSNAVRTLVDLAIGATAGLLVTAAVASAARWFKPARIVFVAILRVLAPLPLIMPLALFSMWFGNAILPFFVVAFGTCIASAAMSVRGVDGPWGETYVRAASFRASLKPMMRQCAALALLLTVASEMIGGTSGIGAYALQDAIGISDITAAVIVSAIMGFALDRAMAWLGGRLARSG